MAAGSRTLVLEALSGAGARYLVVGGVAVVLHGHLRATLDLDLVIDLKAQNVERALAALTALGFVPVVPVPAADFADPATRARWKRDRNMLVFSMWREKDPGFKVDLFVEEPFDFAQAWGRGVEVKVAGATVRVAAIEDLLAMKERAGRAQDIADVEALRKLRP